MDIVGLLLIKRVGNEYSGYGMDKVGLLWIKRVCYG